MEELQVLLRELCAMREVPRPRFSGLHYMKPDFAAFLAIVLCPQSVFTRLLRRLTEHGIDLLSASLPGSLLPVEPRCP